MPNVSGVKPLCITAFRRWLEIINKTRKDLMSGLGIRQNTTTNHTLM